MTNIVSILFTALDLVVLVGCAIAVLRVIPKEKESALWVRVLAWIVYAVLAVILPSLFYNDILTTVVLSIYYVVVGRGLYYKNKTGILYQFIYWVIFLITQYMSAYLVMMVYYSMNIETQISVYLLVVLRISLILPATLILRMLIRKRYARGEKYLKIRGMILVPIFSTVLLFMYIFSSDVFLLRFGYGWLLLFCVLLIIMNLYCVYFWYDVAKSGELKHRLSMMQQQSELTLQYYKDLEENYGHSRKIIHDIRNHLAVIEQSAKMEESNYIEDVHAMLNSLGMKFYTENRMLNIVLNDKLKEFDPEQVECRLGGVNLDFISDMDITTIFANLLDNAVEAQPDRTTRGIKIKGEQIHDFIVIKLSNPWCGEYKEGKSTKDGHEGLGMQNVRSTLEKYHGELQIEQKHEMFSVILAFPNADGK